MAIAIAVANKRNDHDHDEIETKGRPQQQQQSSQLTDLEPPGPDRGKLKKPLLLVVQTLYLLLIFVPVLLYSAIERFWLWFSLWPAKPKSLKGKVALITGSGRGLGRGFAMKFAELGCKLACVDINETINRQTARAINEKYGAGTAVAYTCNVGLSDQVGQLRKRVLVDLGPVHLLVHNAALIAGTTSVTSFDDIYLHGVVTVNLSSHFFMIREFLPDMIKRNQGHIVAVSSLAGFMGIAKASMYVATKHGLMGLMESLHYELQEIPNNRVKTSVVCPYFVNTSALYQKSWRLRIPELNVDRVVNEAVAGIRANSRIITCPAYMYYMANISKILPDRLNGIIRKMYYVKLEVPAIEYQKKLPVYKLLMESFKQFNLVFDE